MSEVRQRCAPERVGADCIPLELARRGNGRATADVSSGGKVQARSGGCGGRASAGGRRWRKVDGAEGESVLKER